MASAAGAALLGRWVCHDLAAAAQISVDGEAMVLRLRGDYGPERPLHLTPWADGVFGVSDPALPMLRLVLTRDDEGGPRASRFCLDSLRSRHLAFVRDEHDTSDKALAP